MTLQIDVTPEDEARIQHAADAAGMSREEYIRHKVLEDPLPEDVLTETEREEIRAGIRRGLADVNAGRVRPLRDWAAEKRAKYDSSGHAPE